MPKKNVDTHKLELTASWEQAGLTNDAWNRAEAFFETYPQAVKWCRTHEEALDSDAQSDSELENNAQGVITVLSNPLDASLEHKAAYQDNAQGLEHFSFIQNQETTEIYAIANKQMEESILGEGGFAKVKRIRNRAGKTFALRIEGRAAREPNDPEKQVMQKLGYFIAEIPRSLDKPVVFKQKSIFQKLYTITELIEGQNLDTIFLSLYFDLVTGTGYAKRLQIALAIARAVEYLHLKRIVHGDIKPPNFNLRQVNDEIIVTALDFGLSVILPENEDSVQSTYGGTPGYMAPEVAASGVFSLQSDMYALGALLGKQGLQLSEDDLPILKSMLCSFSHKRPNITQVISALEAAYQEELRIIKTLRSDDVTAIQELIGSGMSENRLFFMAVEYACANIVKMLLERNPELINKSIEPRPWDTKTTPIMLAVQKGHLDIVQLMAERADMSTLTWKNKNVLEIAVERGQVDIMESLTQNMLKVHSNLWRAESALVEAAEKGNLPIVQFFIEKKQLDINALHNNDTPLMAAAKKGHLAVVAYLIDQGADKSIVKQKSQQTALMMAASSNQLEVVKMLLDVNFIDLTDAGGKTALMLAAAQGHVAIVKYLLAQGANQNLSAVYQHSWSDDPKSALENALEQQHWKVALVLVKTATPDQKKKALMTALEAEHLESQKDHFKLVKFLLMGMAKEIQQEALNAAVKCKHQKVIEYMTKQDRSLHIEPTVEPIYDFITACKLGDLKSVSAYIQSRTQEDAQELGAFYGGTPLCTALAQGHCEIVKLLIDHGAIIDVDKCFTHTPGNFKVIYQILKAINEGKSTAKPQKASLITAASIVLELMIKNHHHKLAALALSLGARIDARMLNLAAQYGSLVVFQHYVLPLNNTEKEGALTVALEIAAQYGHADLVVFLLNHGAKISDTAVSLATKHKQTEIAEFLSERQAPLHPNLAPPSPDTPVPAAKKSKKIKKENTKKNNKQKSKIGNIVLSLVLFAIISGSMAAIVLGGPMEMMAGGAALSCIAVGMGITAIVRYCRAKKADTKEVKNNGTKKHAKKKAKSQSESQLCVEVPALIVTPITTITNEGTKLKLAELPSQQKLKVPANKSETIARRKKAK